MNIDWQEVYTVFLKWDAAVRENPDEFLDAEEAVKLSPEQAAMDRADVFIEYLKQVKENV